MIQKVEPRNIGRDEVTRKAVALAVDAALHRLG